MCNIYCVQIALLVNGQAIGIQPSRLLMVASRKAQGNANGQLADVVVAVICVQYVGDCYANANRAHLMTIILARTSG